MSRDEEARLNARAEEAEKRLCRGIERSKALVADYRKRLSVLRAAGSAAAEPILAAQRQRSRR